MKRVISIVLLASSLALGSGCAICCTPYDYDYTCYGGRYDRVDRTYGRAGSKFAPAHDVAVEDAGNVGAPPEDAIYESHLEEDPELEIR